MRKAMTVILAALLVVGIISITLLTGCGGEESQTDVSTRDITEGDIGVPFYPGAKVGDDTINSLAESKGDVSLVAIYTDDDVDKVISWYRDQLSGKDDFVDSSMMIDGDKMGLFFYDDAGMENAITIMKADPGDPGKTVIIITSQ